MKSFAVFAFALLLLASPSPFVSSQGIERDNLTATTPIPLKTPSTLVQANSTPPYYLDLSQPLLPALVNGYFLQPLANLNAQISQTAAGIPYQFAQGGQSLGQALMVPIQAGTSTANNVVTQINSTLISLSNGTVALLEPVFSVPIALIGQVNTTVNGLALNALNYSQGLVGQGLNTFGESVSSAGQNVQQLGGSLVQWAQSIEQMRQQLSNSTYTTSNSLSNTTSSFPSNASSLNF